MTNIELVDLIKRGKIKIERNNIPNVPIKKIISYIYHDYNGDINFDCDKLTIDNNVVTVEGHTFLWYGQTVLLME